MANTRLINNVAGGTTRSNIAKVGLGYSLNMYPEIQDINDKSCSIMMRSINGMVEAQDFSEDGKCRGMYRVSRCYGDGSDVNEPGLYAVFGQSLYFINKNNKKYYIGHIDSIGTKCNMCETGGNGSAYPHLIICDGVNVYNVHIGEPIIDQREKFKNHGRIPLPKRVATSDEQLITPSHCAYLYGYLVVNDSGSDAFYTSYIYPFEKYKETEDEYYDLFMINTEKYKDRGHITYSEWQPDNTIALISNGSKLYTFGTRSWQAFSFNDDKANPFSSPDNAAGNVGIKAVNSVAMLGPTTIWLGSSDIGDNGIYMIKDVELSRISTQDIEREINNLVNPENAYAQIWQEHQHLFYSITFEDSNLTYVYDVTEGLWTNRSSYNDINKQVFWRYNNATFSYNKVFFGTNDGKLCYMDENKYDEHDGRPILKLRRSGMNTNDGRPFYIDAAELIVNNGQHSLNNKYTNMELNPRVSIRYSWDGMTWSDYEDNYLGKIGEYEYNTIFWQLGMGKYFTIEISTTEKIPFCIENLKVQWDGCSNF